MAFIRDTRPKPQDYIQQFVQQYMQQQNQNKQFGIQQQEVDDRRKYQEGLLGVQQSDQKHTELQAEAKALVDSLAPVFASDRNTAARIFQEKLAKRPELERYIGDYARERQNVAAENATQNSWKNRENLTGIAAEQGINAPALAQNAAFELTSPQGKQLEAPAFGNAEQRETGAKGYSDYLDVKGDKRVSANQKYQSDAYSQAQRDQNASQERITSQDRIARIASHKTQPVVGSDYQSERQGRIVDQASSLHDRTGMSTAGLIGALLSRVPATRAKDFSADLDALRANIAFGELQEMRDASKTGGALGQVAVREIELLYSALGALEQAQSPPNLRKNLKEILKSVHRWNSAKSTSDPRVSGADGGNNADDGAGPRVGDTKTFPNGKVGRWDGRGWDEVTGQ